MQERKKKPVELNYSTCYRAKTIITSFAGAVVLSPAKRLEQFPFKGINQVIYYSISWRRSNRRHVINDTRGKTFLFFVSFFSALTKNVARKFVCDIIHVIALEVVFWWGSSSCDFGGRSKLCLRKKGSWGCRDRDFKFFMKICQIFQNWNEILWDMFLFLL